MLLHSIETIPSYISLSKFDLIVLLIESNIAIPIVEFEILKFFIIVSLQLTKYICPALRKFSEVSPLTPT